MIGINIPAATRAASDAGSDANLAALSLSLGTLSPPFCEQVEATAVRTAPARAA